MYVCQLVRLHSHTRTLWLGLLCQCTACSAGPRTPRGRSTEFLVQGSWTPTRTPFINAHGGCDVGPIIGRQKASASRARQRKHQNTFRPPTRTGTMVRVRPLRTCMKKDSPASLPGTELVISGQPESVPQSGCLADSMPSSVPMTPQVRLGEA